MTRPNTPDDFWAKAIETDGCWLWSGGVQGNGYGWFRMDGKRQSAHRWSWMLTHGHEPEHQVNHRCGNRLCVNPDHLYDGTQSQNMLDAIEHGTHPNAAKTHCPNGHPYTDDNLVPSHSGRRCRTCHNEGVRARWHAKMQDPEFRERQRVRSQERYRRSRPPVKG